MELDDADGGFALEVTRFRPTLTTTASPVASSAELDSIINQYADEREVVFGLDCDEGAGGVFYLFVSGDRDLGSSHSRAMLHRAQSSSLRAIRGGVPP